MPLTAETRGLIGADQIARMKRGAYVVNTARGGLIDEAALVGALESGHLAAAALDVFETEPLPARRPLAKLNNVVLTPHISAGTRDALQTKMRALFANVQRFIAASRWQTKCSRRHEKREGCVSRWRALASPAGCT